LSGLAQGDIIRTMQTSESTSAVAISGAVERIVYADEQNQYTVLKLTEDGTGQLHTVVGNLVGLTPGERIRVEGRWEQHKKFGRQLRVEHYQVIAPATLDGIEKYLGSGMIDGIGPVLAKRLVKEFGEQILDLIEQDPKRLFEVEGIGRKKQRQIVEAYGRQRGIREVMVFLQGHGVSSALAARIFKHYGPGAISVVRTHPYQLASEVDGIGFKTADRIASQMGIDPSSPERAKAGLLYMLGEMTGEGHTCYPLRPLQEEVTRALEIELPVVEQVTPELAASGEIVIERELEGEPVYTAALHEAEKGVAERLAALARHPPPQLKPVNRSALREPLRLTEQQQRAVELAALSKVAIITGGPGVGKTTVVRCIVPVLEESGRRVALACPTGRAAKRLSESTGQPASTIHRLLKYEPARRQFAFDEHSPLPYDAVIIDEASMLDIALTRDLLRAMRPSASLILVGDADQLPAVGPGDVLRNLVQCGRFPVAHLEQIFRQAERSLIIWNAHRINHGEFPVLKVKDGEDQDFYFIEKEEPDEVLRTVLDLCGRRIPAKFHLDPVRDIQVITPMHRGEVGVENLNAELRARLNPSGAEIGRGRSTYGAGDKVMQIRNNYDKEVYNGDIGVVALINRIDGYLTVRYEGRDVNYTMDELDELAPAYAISVHKSQGSEYPAVVLPLVTQHYVMLQRNLLYTAVTRAKRLLVIVGSRRALGTAVRNDRMRRRYSFLAERIEALIG